MLRTKTRLPGHPCTQYYNYARIIYKCFWNGEGIARTFVCSQHSNVCKRQLRHIICLLPFLLHSAILIWQGCVWSVPGELQDKRQ